jgi:hypothetical protein
LAEADSVEMVLDGDGLLDVEGTFTRVMARHRRRTPCVIVLPGMRRGVRSMLQVERDRQVAERSEAGSTEAGGTNE